MLRYMFMTCLSHGIYIVYSWTIYTDSMDYVLVVYSIGIY